MPDSSKDESGGYRRDKRAIVGWLATSLGGLAIVIGGWAHAILWNHSQAIVRLEVNRENDQHQSDKLERKVDEVIHKLDDLRDVVIRRAP